MKHKNCIRLLCVVLAVSMLFIGFKKQKPYNLQHYLLTNTHQQLRNIKNNLQQKQLDGTNRKSLQVDQKYLDLIGNGSFSWCPQHNQTIPVIVTYSLADSSSSQVIGLIFNVNRVLTNHTLLVYNLGLNAKELKILDNYCNNNSRCHIVTFNLDMFPSHVSSKHYTRAYRPLIIQDALQKTGAILFIENNYRFNSGNYVTKLLHLYERTQKTSGVLVWSTPLKNPVSSLTHKKMFEYFETKADNFLFVPMVNADILLVFYRRHDSNVMLLKWVQCALIEECIAPIGAQPAGCRFDKKPQYRYSGCHNYDTSALNIVLALEFQLDATQYTYAGIVDDMFNVVALDEAKRKLQRDHETNATPQWQTERRQSSLWPSITFADN